MLVVIARIVPVLFWQRNHRLQGCVGGGASAGGGGFCLEAEAKEKVPPPPPDIHAE